MTRKRTDAQKQAEKTYDAKRAEVALGTRVQPEIAAHLDQVRGKMSRSAWLKALVLRELRRNEPP